MSQTAVAIEDRPELSAVGVRSSAAPITGGIGASRRFAMIDGLRAIAAIMVMIFHFIASGSFYPIFHDRLPHVYKAAASGYLGVDVFFVISGFVIAYSIRHAQVTGRFIRNFAIRRSLRLDPPYWCTIVLTLPLLWYYNNRLHQHQCPLPTGSELLVNLFYLTGVAHVQPMLPVFWTLCLEVQFYLVFVTCLWVGKLIGGPGGRQLNPASAALLGLLGAGSAVINGYWINPHWFDGWFLFDWNLFLLGALCWWTISKTIRPVWLLGDAVVLLIVWNRTGSYGTMTGLLTAGLICGIAGLGRLETFLGNRPLQFIGRISYSLYLLHGLIGPQIDGWIAWHFPGNLAAAAGAVVFSITVSVLAAWLMHRWVEQPGIRLGQRLAKRRVSAAVVRRTRTAQLEAALSRVTLDRNAASPAMEADASEAQSHPGSLVSCA